jgi:hypothetical protein
MTFLSRIARLEALFHPLPNFREEPGDTSPAERYRTGECAFLHLFVNEAAGGACDEKHLRTRQEALGELTLRERWVSNLRSGGAEGLARCIAVSHVGWRSHDSEEFSDRFDQLPRSQAGFGGGLLYRGVLLQQAELTFHWFYESS